LHPLYRATANETSSPSGPQSQQYVLMSSEHDLGSAKRATQESSFYGIKVSSTSVTEFQTFEHGCDYSPKLKGTAFRDQKAVHFFYWRFSSVGYMGELHTRKNLSNSNAQQVCAFSVPSECPASERTAQSNRNYR
jgi:hypothetical protein